MNQALARTRLMVKEKSEMVLQMDAKDVVLSCVSAINREDFDAARQYVGEDMSFTGVLGSRRGRDAYFKEMEKIRLKYDVKKIFVEGSDVCLFYDLAVSGATVFVCAWYQVREGKISTLRVVFDPRPLLAEKAA